MRPVPQQGDVEISVYKTNRARLSAARLGQYYYLVLLDTHTHTHTERERGGSKGRWGWFASLPVMTDYPCHQILYALFIEHGHTQSV